MLLFYFFAKKQASFENKKRPCQKLYKNEKIIKHKTFKKLKHKIDKN